MKAILFDASKCNGCYGCQLACKDEFCGNDWEDYASEQPITGQFWCKVSQKDRGKVPEVKVQYVPFFGAQTEAVREYAPEVLMERDDDLIVIQPSKAKGRKDIADKFEGIYWNEELQIPQGCNGCAHLLDNGWEVPRCVDVCATEALKVVDLDDAPEGAVPAPGQEPEHPHVLYMNIPKAWIYGCVVDRAKNEVLVGANVALLDTDGNEVARVETDEFGEFRLKELDSKAYRVSIEAEGYNAIVLDADASEEDVVLGDIFAVPEGQTGEAQVARGCLLFDNAVDAYLAAK